jgi:tripartite-type tricarboxylate transporter receptor subunit TctC
MADKMGIEFSYVPYDGTRERMTALLSGAIDMGVLNVASGRKYMEGGELQGFAIAAEERSKFLPEMPTLKEVGVDMLFALERGIVAPKGTPRDVIDHWSAIFKQAAEDPDLLAQMDAKGTGVAYQDPDEYRAWADGLYADFEAVAIKIGMYKK